jgi:hypothetical protein
MASVEQPVRVIRRRNRKRLSAEVLFASAKSRFAERYVVAESGCWEWTGRKDENGYGRIQVLGRSNHCAHRLSYELNVGLIPDGLNACHRCDNPGCVNPAHLFIGTQGDNMRDCARKGRLGMQRNPERMVGDNNISHTRPECVRRGERHHSAKLTSASVTNIRFLRSLGASVADCGEWFGVSPSLAGLIARREIWRHV